MEEMMVPRLGISAKERSDELIHGTTYSNWISIQCSPRGLRKMNREHIHFSYRGTEAEKGKIAGVSDASILIYVDKQRAEKDGITFTPGVEGATSPQDTVGTKGFHSNGYLPMKYFTRVVDAHNGALLWENDSDAEVESPVSPGDQGQDQQQQTADYGLFQRPAAAARPSSTGSGSSGRLQPPGIHFVRIDVHTHILPHNLDICKGFKEKGYVYLEHHMEDRAKMMKDGELFREIKCNCYAADARVTDMNDTDCHIQVLSTVPVMFCYWAKEKDDAVALARYLNDDIAAICKKYPTRFVGLATLPLQFPEESVKELRRCMTVLGMKGIQIGTHVNDWELSDEKLLPIFATAEELGAAIFVHPWDMMGQKEVKKYWLPWLVGMPAETSRAICHILFSGILDKFPKLRVCFAHGGGSFPYTAGRIEHGYRCRPDLCAIDNATSPMHYVARKPRPQICSKCEEEIADSFCESCNAFMCRSCDVLFHSRGKMKSHTRKPSVSVVRTSSRFWVDSLTHDPLALDFVLQVIGEDRVVLGSDYPFPLGEWRPGDMICKHRKLSVETKRNLLSLNACEFLNISIQDFVGPQETPGMIDIGMSDE